MSIKVTLTLENESYDILHCRYGFHRKVNSKGLPKGGMKSGEILLMLESSRSTALLEKMLTKEPVSVPGKLEFINEEDFTTIRTLEWEEGYIYEVGEKMWGNSSLPMTQTIAITPLRLDINRSIKMDRRFPQTYAFWWEKYKPEENNTSHSPVTGESIIKDIKKIEWIDSKTHREIKQSLSNIWVSLSLELENFNAKDKLRIVIKEKKNLPINKKDSELEFTVKAGKDSQLLIKKAFRFKQDSNPNKEVQVFAYWEDNKKEGWSTLIEHNGGIWAATDKDAETMLHDIHAVLFEQKFNSLRSLIQLDRNHFVYIDANALKSALDGVTLTLDESTYIDMIYNTINSTSEYWVEYLNTTGFVSDVGAKHTKEYLNNIQENIGNNSMTPEGKMHTSIIKVYGGEGLNIPIKNGSYSFIFSNQQNREVTSNHEVFGHGIPSAKKSDDITNNSNAIRTDNLVRRILGLKERDGSDHAGAPINSPYTLPFTK